MGTTTICTNCGVLGNGRFCAQCGHPISTEISRPDGVLKESFFKIIGLSEALKVLMTLHKPASGLGALLSHRGTAFKEALLAYIEFMLLVPVVLNALLLPIGRAIEYPVMVQGLALDDQIIGTAVSAAGLLIGILVIYVLPRSLFRPNGKMIVIAASLFITMYSMAYMTLSDFVKLIIWSLTADFMMSVYFGTGMFFALIAFQVYMMRRVLELRWHAIAIFLALGLTVGVIWGYTLAALGLVTY